MIRLNLGSGDKPIPGYINVDIASSRGGKRPDIEDDVRILSTIEESYADEILAVHLIEHIDRWEVLDVLVRWNKILKPGGKLVIETPNLIAACKALLENPLKGARPGKEGQLTMWPLYGDPSWRDPLMMHKWLYTPQSLAEVIHDAGFEKIKQTPAQFKMREPRDMRLIAFKPS
jgi:predicted SAM-dependent methyltransferase